MTAAKTKPVWRGSKALRRYLVAVGDLEPFPGNPRRGDVEAIRASLRRFGQVRPILVDGARIVAGHHLAEAATEEGWTHVAAIPNEFANEEEARAYLLTDNRSAELGHIDPEALAAQLDALRAGVGLEGTGYTEGDRRAIERELEKLRAAAVAPPEFPSVGDVDVDYVCPRCHFGWKGDPLAGGDADATE